MKTFCHVPIELEDLKTQTIDKKRLDLTIFEQAEKTAAGTFESGVYFLGLAQDMVGYSMDENNASLVTAEMQSKVEAAAAGIINGSIPVEDWSQQ